MSRQIGAGQFSQGGQQAFSNIAPISNVTFQQMHHHIFRQMTTVTAPFRTKLFQILPSTHLLMRLISKTVCSQNGNLEIAMDDLQVFKSLCMESEKFQVATKMFKGEE